eukprot:210949-Chlamydomonas_euryale.AAC.4
MLRLMLAGASTRSLCDAGAARLLGGVWQCGRGGGGCGLSWRSGDGSCAPKLVGIGSCQLPRTPAAPRPTGDEATAISRHPTIYGGLRYSSSSHALTLARRRHSGDPSRKGVR